MTRHVAAGIDGSAESTAAAQWAAREAAVREVPLLLVHVEEWPYTPELPLPYADAAAAEGEKLLHDESEHARKSHPGLEVLTRHVRGGAAEKLTAAAQEAELTALGSRGFGRALGYLLGSVSLTVVGAARQPVVLVRALEEQPRSQEGALLVGVDLQHPSEGLLAFAFAQADRRGLPLRVLHAWTLPVSYGQAAIVDPGIGTELTHQLHHELSARLKPWRERYAGVECEARVVLGSAAYQMTEESSGAELVMVGRRPRRAPFGPRVGHVVQALVHHSPAPVAVVPLDEEAGTDA
ncbi:stress-inducible protein [Streptomyces albus]|uniref:Stress-inducible protein n=1 Tax=Streptomyces albus (strain ATCC 21838 / DSM 41398 / FERM P-419 / JCM 4703 / NBRC 107858) TaxID=1081613 RepID=A0A0B5EWN3_STRA4|nr:stress-inducible protein [Streptomyces albus]AOU77932.1 stress-inducible protein [Streptomyces albus]AYN33686.1 universal stress protein [Streptomyces albus]